MLDGLTPISLVWLLLGAAIGAIFGWLAAQLRALKRIGELSTALEMEGTKTAGLAPAAKTQ
jgi:hypothetical protein